jgi:hypothetical protein
MRRYPFPASLFGLEKRSISFSSAWRRYTTSSYTTSVLSFSFASM